jgi:hypothetical protein
MIPNAGQKLNQAISERSIMPFIGVYDVFSASIVADRRSGM